MSPRLMSCRLFVCLTTLLLTAAVRADFMLVSQDVTLDHGMADFTLTFNQTPDFLTADSFGRPANSFQVDFNGSSTEPRQQLDAGYDSDITAVVRGDEIRYANAIRIRSATGDGGPTAGGWGPVTAAVPFRLVDKTVTFAAPVRSLGLTGDTFHYTAYSLSYGDLTAQASATMVPTPTAAAGGIACLAALFLMSRWAKRRLA